MSASFDRLSQLCAKRYSVDASSITPEGDVFETLKIDSFQAAELMSELEMEFDVEIPDYELQDIKTFGALSGAIDARL
ncbi:MAG: acyl carrier protein [Nannocystales bacterium]